MPERGYGLGIDLGTTYTAAATWRDGRAETVPLGLRAHTVPSVLFLREDGVVLVGEAAVRRGVTEPDRVAREFKRHLGDDVPFLLGDDERTAEELTGQLLRWVVGQVAEREGGPAAHVTLTHPATWGEHRTRLLVTAAEEAGLADVGLLVEPVAAAAYHASTGRLEPGSALAVYDLGGGTFDATVVRKTATGFAVEGAPGGDDALGGVDFDQVVVDHVATVLGPAWRTLDLDDPVVLAGVARVREQAVEAKEALSGDSDATVPVILPGTTREVRITRGEFEAAVRIPLLRTVDLLARTVETAGLRPEDLHAVLLVGGSSRIPLVSRLIAAELGVPVAVDAHPQYAVCLGAAIAAGARLAPPAPAPTGAVQPLPTRPVRRPVAPDPVEPPPTVRTPTAPEPPAAAPDPTTQPPPPLVVDLPATGITDAVDTAVATTPSTPAWGPVVTTDDAPLVVTVTGDRRRGRRAALIAIGVALLVVAVLVALLVRPGAVGTGGGAAGADPAAAGPAAVAGAGTARLVPEPLAAAAGDRVLALSVAPAGAVAVGSSGTEGAPRAWRADASGAWAPAQVPLPPSLVGGMNGVAVAPGPDGPAVAVGWLAPRPAAGPALPPGATRRAAVWTSTDGASWQLSGDDLGRPGLGELSDVVVGPAGGFVAAGTDWSTDPAGGDGAVLTTADGVAWQALPVVGLDGSGPAPLRRLLVDGGGYVAVGTRPEGGIGQPAVWTSPDAVTWAPGPVLPHAGVGGGDATGVVRPPGGPLVVVGSTSTVGGRAAAVWSGPGPEGLRPYDVDDPGAVLDGVATRDGRVSAVGGGDGGPAAWTVELGP